MADKQVKCSVCKQPMTTAFGSALNRIGPVTCRRCFGEQSYGGKNSGSHPIPAGQLVSSPGE